MNIYLSKRPITASIILFFLLTSSACAQKDKGANQDLTHFVELIHTKNPLKQASSLKYIDAQWKPEFEIMMLELIYFNYNTLIGQQLLSMLEKNTKKKFNYDFNEWYEWLWSKEERLIEDYHLFKAALHEKLDSKFSNYFTGRQNQTSIRFDEIRWGGVVQDGIPPLRNPNMIEADNANYLNDTDVIFGIEVNGDFRAYPKRILAWHEMFVDDVGGIPVAGVYCTLCGTVILYKTEHKGVSYNMGTSGFLYRSNKLMYDKKTQSLWNTIWGKPVVGPLVGKGIEFDYLSVVTTTWGIWKQRHPETKVLSLQTGHRRNYDEGQAYKQYFATDDLMFNVPSLDKQLKNKQSILAIRFPETNEAPLAISTRFLKKNPIYVDKIGAQSFVVLTDKSGANRVYETIGHTFKSYDGAIHLMDSNNIQWSVYENRLESSDGQILKRIHTFNAFWFGWQAAFPDTRLVK